MNPYDYFKLATRHIYLILLLTIVSTIGGYLYSLSINTNSHTATLFVTLGIQDKSQSKTSSYENLQAADQMTESIQGWFKDPSFIKEININSPLLAKKQEKGNLLISYSAIDKEKADNISNQILSTLGARISQYNSNSDLQISIATHNLDINQQAAKSSIMIFIGTIIGLIMGFFGAWLWEYLRQVTTSNPQITSISNHNILASYTNKLDFEKNHQFLCKYLNEKHKQQALQIIDLTRNNKFALDTIHKHTDLGNITNLRLPADYNRISAKTPALIMIEIGYSKIQTIKEIINLEIPQLEIISFFSTMNSHPDVTRKHGDNCCNRNS